MKKILLVALCASLTIATAMMFVPYTYAETEGATPERMTLQEEPQTKEGDIVENPTGENPPAKSPDLPAAEKKLDKKTSAAERHKDNQNKIVAYAKKQIGKKYKYGTKGPKTFDCIGLVYYVFAHSGAKLKTGWNWKKACTMKKTFKKYIVSNNVKKAQAGDIIVYYKGNSTRHACIAIGNGRCINASKKGVKNQKIPKYGGCKTAVIRLTA